MPSNNLSKRKHPRLKNYDYSQNGSYFITICVKNRECILSEVCVGRDAHIPPFTKLSHIGETVDEYIHNIDCVYGNVAVDNYVIMPNHIHLLITVFDFKDNGGMRASRPTIMTVVRSLKTMVTKRVGYSVWQESFFDSIIRNETEYLRIWKYIDDNPSRWFCNGNDDRERQTKNAGQCAHIPPPDF